MDGHKNHTNMEKRIADWQVSVPKQTDLKQRVMGRIAFEEAEKESVVPPRFAFLRPLFTNSTATFVAALAVLAVAGVSSIALHEHNRRVEEESCRMYFLSIDPVAHVAADNFGEPSAAAKPPSVVEMLDWMKSRLNLSRDQFERMVNLHRDYKEKFSSLYAELCEMKSEYRTFDEARREDNAIDFLALYDLLQKRDAARQDSSSTSREFLGLIYQILTPEQKTKFMSLFPSDSIQPRMNSAGDDTHAGA